LDDLGSPPTERDLKKAKGANFLVLLLHGKNFSVNVEYQAGRSPVLYEALGPAGRAIPSDSEAVVLP
jgi:hypothetical protein